MGFLKGLQISSSALSAERLRLNVLSSNVANANVTQTDEGGPYRRKDVIFSATGSGEKFGDLMRMAFDDELKEVKVTGIAEDRKPGERIYNPEHPHADTEGYVEMPNVSVMEEMVNIITSTRSFEANTTALNSTKSMAETALKIGRG
jgi:flagellar basal-body rod protein FlgC